MKKIITFIAIMMAMAVTTSCNRPFFNKNLNEEFTEFKTAHPNGVFYESHVILNKNLEDVSSVRELRVNECENVFQDSVFCFLARHNFAEDTYKVEVVEDLWLGSASIDPTKLILTLEEALKAYEESEYKTTGNKVTLRSPVGPELLPPYYIIGQHNSPCFVRVNALTGEVGLIR